MREDFLHFIWKYKKIQTNQLFTSQGENIEIVSEGTHNQLSGPDFFNAQVKISDQLWAGNVEIHIKSSDWYVHGHENDTNYDNVILHVVWEDDVAIFRKDNTQIPTLELKKIIPQKVLERYKSLFDTSKKNFINCEKQITSIDDFSFKNWLERLFFERLEQKAIYVEELLEKYNNDWEQVLFSLLLKNFGLKINGNSFKSLSEHLPFSTVRKISDNTTQLEAIFFGMVGFLEDDEISDHYYTNLRNEYSFLAHKFKLNKEGVEQPEFFKLRPPNFPTIRLSQFAAIYAENQNLFSKILASSTLEDIYKLFNVQASDYWTTHFTFGKASKKSEKKLTKKFIELLLINTILPLKFCYARSLNRTGDVSIVDIISAIKKEKNNIIDQYLALGVKVDNAFESQAILELYNNYCSKNNCLQCAVGNHLLKGNT
ncbi:MAG: DUF2851 family protein [Cellulophaga sp.]|nr:DUF2851 family protein [Cellulophaga sp.]